MSKTKTILDCPVFLKEDQEESDLQYEAILAYCKKNETCFVDGEFEHSAKSYRRPFWERFLRRKLNWIRPTQFVQYEPITHNADTNTYLIRQKPPWTLYDNPQASAVRQNGLGNCGLITVLVLLPNHPMLLHSIFRSRRTICDYGVYQVRLCVFGEWKTLLLDDWFPAQQNFVCTALNFDNQLWSLLLEKAIGKAFGSFTSLQGIVSSLALAMLTGHPSRRLYEDVVWRDADELWQLLYDSFQQGFLMTCASKSKPKKWKARDDEGIVFSHSYAVLEVCLFQGHRLIRLRDPCGFPRWDGAWGLSWSGWTEDLQLDLKLSRSKDDRAFWIEIGDFHRYMCRMYICKYRPSWLTTRMRLFLGGPLTDQHMMLRLTVQEKCSVCIEAFLIGERSDRQMTFWLTIHQMEQNGVISELEKVLICEQSSEDVELGPGTYALAIFKWIYKEHHHNVVVHSSKAVHVDMIPLNPFLLQKAYCDLITLKGRMVKVNRDDVKILRYDDAEVCLVMAENHNKEKHLHIHSDCTHKALRFVYSSREFLAQSIYGDVIPPMHRQVVVALERTIISSRPSEFPIHFNYFMSEKTETVVYCIYSMQGIKKGKSVPEIGAFDFHHFKTRMEN